MKKRKHKRISLIINKSFSIAKSIKAVKRAALKACLVNPESVIEYRINGKSFDLFYKKADSYKKRNANYCGKRKSSDWNRKKWRMK